MGLSAATPHDASPQEGSSQEDMATLAKGGRTNTLGFLLRLLGGIPFLFVGFRLYGVDEMGRFAAAFVVIEILALVCALGEKRGLAQRLREGEEDHEGPEANLVFDGMLTSLLFSLVACAILLAFPVLIFPSGTNSTWDMWMIAAIPAFALTEILLAAQAYKYDIATTVRARALVEPWTKSILVAVLFYVPALAAGGIALAFLAAIYAALATALEIRVVGTLLLEGIERPRPRVGGHRLVLDDVQHVARGVLGLAVEVGARVLRVDLDRTVLRGALVLLVDLLEALGLGIEIACNFVERAIRQRDTDRAEARPEYQRQGGSAEAEAGRSDGKRGTCGVAHAEDPSRRDRAGRRRSLPACLGGTCTEASMGPGPHGRPSGEGLASPDPTINGT